MALVLHFLDTKRCTFSLTNTYMDADMRPIAESAIRKLNGMSEEEYAALSFDADGDAENEG